MHCDSELMATVEIHLPELQTVQSFSESPPFDFPYLPVAQLMQSLMLELATDSEYLPLGHRVQSLSASWLALFCATSVKYVPDGQSLQPELEPVCATHFPAAQTVHLEVKLGDDVTARYRPAWHRWHCVLRFTAQTRQRYFPTGQLAGCLHALLATDEAAFELHRPLGQV